MKLLSDGHCKGWQGLFKQNEHFHFENYFYKKAFSRKTLLACLLGRNLIIRVLSFAGSGLALKNLTYQRAAQHALINIANCHARLWRRAENRFQGCILFDHYFGH